jgi:hypothetical protein
VLDQRLLKLWLLLVVALVAVLNPPIHNQAVVVLVALELCQQLLLQQLETTQ